MFRSCNNVSIIMICSHAITGVSLDQLCDNQKLQSELGHRVLLSKSGERGQQKLENLLEAARRSGCLETGTKRE